MIFGLAKQLGGGEQLVDLVQEGNLGFLHAVDKFNPSFNTKFSTYAHWWIRQAINRTRQNSELISIPEYILFRIKIILEFRHQYFKENGCSPSTEEIAKNTGLKVNQVKNALAAHATQNPLSLNQSLTGEDGPSDEIGNFFSSSDQEDPDTVVVQDLFRQQLEEHIVTALSDPNDEVANRRFWIFKLRLGLVDGKSHSLHEIGQIFELTQERIRQQEEEAWKIFRQYLKKTHITADDFFRNTTGYPSTVEVLG